jgi:hypothetical protein
LTKVNGVDTPAKIWVNYMTVDHTGNLYVGNNTDDQPVQVYGSTANGPVAPARAIGGDQTGMGRPACPGGYAIAGMAVNDAEEIHVLYKCLPDRTASDAPVVLYKFAAMANGNIAPAKLLTLPGGTVSGRGLALDSAGNAYVCMDGSRVIEFPATASGAANPSNVLTSPVWSGMPPPVGEDDWFDPSGTIVVH